MSPTRTSREGFAASWFAKIRFKSQALDACSRVLKKRAAQSHLSIRIPVTLLFSYTITSTSLTLFSIMQNQAASCSEIHIPTE
jgi:hypothetical protein